MSDDFEPLEPSLRSYLRARGNVDVPDDLLARAAERVHSESAHPRMTRARWPVAAAVAVVVALAIVTFALGSRPNLLPDGSPGATAVGLSSAEPSPSDSATPPPSVFPLTVLGMPVIEVPHASRLLDEGRLDGRAVAVRGYWIQSLVPSCPAPGRYVTPLERWCSYSVLSDVAYEGVTCGDGRNGSNYCQSNAPPAGATTLQPILTNDTGASEGLWRSFGNETWKAGIPAVLIGHADDPRAWHCPAETRDDCRREFVVDRLAWSMGSNVDLAAPSGEVHPQMSLDDVQGLVGPGELLAAWAGSAAEAPAIDPRLGGVPTLVWIIRTLREEDDSDDPTRGVDVWLIEDIDGSITKSLSLDVGDDYQPGTFRAQAWIRSNSGNTEVHYVIDAGAATVQYLQPSGWQMSGESQSARLLPGLAAVLEPGTYVVRASQSDLRIPSTYPRDQCSSEFDLDALEDLLLEVAFDGRGPCVWREPTFEEPGLVTQ